MKSFNQPLIKEKYKKRDQHGFTPLHQAIFCEGLLETEGVITCSHAVTTRPDVVSILAKKCDKEAQDNLGRTALHLAVLSNDYALVLRLVTNHINLCAQTLAGNTPLHLAAMTMGINHNIVNLFLEREHLLVTNKVKQTPLDMAYFCNNKCVIDKIEEYITHELTENVQNFRSLLEPNLIVSQEDATKFTLKKNECEAVIFTKKVKLT